MCKWTKLAINKAMLWDFLRWCPTISAMGSERYTSEFHKAEKPKDCGDAVSKSARDMAEGLWCFMVWLVFLLHAMGWSTSAQMWNLLWGAVSLATSCEQVINKQEQMLQSNSWEKRSGVLRYPWCFFFPFCIFVPCLLFLLHVWNSTLFSWGTGLPCSGQIYSLLSLGLGLMQELARENGWVLPACHGFEFHPILLQHITMEGDMDAWGDKRCTIWSCSEVCFKAQKSLPFSKKIPRHVTLIQSVSAQWRKC